MAARRKGGSRGHSPARPRRLKTAPPVASGSSRQPNPALDRLPRSWATVRTGTAAVPPTVRARTGRSKKRHRRTRPPQRLSRRASRKRAEAPKRAETRESDLIRTQYLAYPETETPGSPRPGTPDLGAVMNQSHRTSDRAIKTRPQAPSPRTDLCRAVLSENTPAENHDSPTPPARLPLPGSPHSTSNSFPFKSISTSRILPSLFFPRISIAS